MSKTAIRWIVSASFVAGALLPSASFAELPTDLKVRKKFFQKFRPGLGPRNIQPKKAPPRTKKTELKGRVHSADEGEVLIARPVGSAEESRALQRMGWKVVQSNDHVRHRTILETEYFVALPLATDGHYPVPLHKLVGSKVLLTVEMRGPEVLVVEAKGIRR